LKRGSETGKFRWSGGGNYGYFPKRGPRRAVSRFFNEGVREALAVWLKSGDGIKTMGRNVASRDGDFLPEYDPGVWRGHEDVAGRMNVQDSEGRQAKAPAARKIDIFKLRGRVKVSTDAKAKRKGKRKGGFGHLLRKKGREQRECGWRRLHRFGGVEKESAYA